MKKFFKNLFTPFFVGALVGVPTTLCSCQAGAIETVKTTILNLNLSEDILTLLITKPDRKSDDQLYGLSRSSDLVPITCKYRVSNENPEVFHEGIVNAKAIFEISDDYYFLCLNENPQSEAEAKLCSTQNYLVSKVNGECFPFPANSIPAMVCLDYETTRKGVAATFQFDWKGNMYYIAATKQGGKKTYVIHKANILNPNNITVSQISAKGDDLNGGNFGVDKDSNVAYCCRHDEKFIYKYVSSGGSIYTDWLDANFCEFWSAVDGKIYSLSNVDALTKDSSMIKSVYFDTNTSEVKRGEYKVAGFTIDDEHTISRLWVTPETELNPFDVMVRLNTNPTIVVFSDLYSIGESEPLIYEFGQFGPYVDYDIFIDSKYRYYALGHTTTGHSYNTVLQFGRPHSGDISYIPWEDSDWHANASYIFALDKELDVYKPQKYANLVYAYEQPDGTTNLFVAYLEQYSSYEDLKFELPCHVTWMVDTNQHR